jgi:diaminopimelate epimerase
MNIHFFKYHGAGNDFVIIDNRDMTFDADNFSLIEKICLRRFGIGADGLMLLQEHPRFDFEMRYFNSDGREASMCGNGGRCIVAFANKLKIIGKKTTFLAVDGEHRAILENDGEVNLRMGDVGSFEVNGDDYVLDTGSPHFVRFVETLEGLDVLQEGRAIRTNDRFRSKGINVNFAQLRDGALTVYTYERGVEAETLACGTGITASALCAALRAGISSGTLQVTAKGGLLSVSFEKSEEGFSNIWLKGPVAYVFEGKFHG